MKKIAIIGTGPAGMLAAWAALMEGFSRITFFHPPGQLRSTIHGAQYVHGIIHDLPTEIELFRVRYRMFGDEQGYRRHIYGDAVQQGGTSWGNFGPYEFAWPMDQIYEFLLAEFQGAKYQAWSVGPQECEVLVDNFDYVFNTAPLKHVAGGQGQFTSETVYIAPKNVYQVPRNEIWYFGDGRLAYRASNILGQPSTEYPGHIKCEDIDRKIRKELKQVVKPLRAEGVDLPGVYRLGRYGKWQKGILVHHVYEEARNILSRGLPWTATLPA